MCWQNPEHTQTCMMSVWRSCEHAHTNTHTHRRTHICKPLKSIALCYKHVVGWRWSDVSPLSWSINQNADLCSVFSDSSCLTCDPHLHHDTHRTYLLRHSQSGGGGVQSRSRRGSSWWRQKPGGQLVAKSEECERKETKKWEPRNLF